MPHVLQTVREAAVAALTGLPTTGSNVLQQDPYPAENVPALVVATAADPVVEEMETPQVLRWDVQIAVACIAKGAGNVAAQLDAITLEVQAALCAVSSIGGRQVVITPVSFEPPTFSGEGDQPVARRTVIFTVYSLHTTATAPDTLI